MKIERYGECLAIWDTRVIEEAHVPWDITLLSIRLCDSTSLWHVNLVLL